MIALLNDASGAFMSYSENNSKDAQTHKLPGLGAMSWNMLASIGISSPKALLQRDPFDVYAELYRTNVSRNLNMLYALIGAVENKHWQAIARERRTEILLRLDEMGIAPK
jgi:DNA transformation protein and related proteins